MEPWQIWIIASLLFFIAEIFTVGFVVICFAVGGLGGAIAAACGLSVIWQIAIFAVATALCFFFLRPIALKLFFRKDDTKTNADAIIGRIGTVSEAIDPAADSGRVKIDGDDWKAVSADSQAIAAGEHVEIISREGLIVKVKQVNQ